MSNRTFVFSEAEYQHILTTLQGCKEELETLMEEVSWYTTELTDRVDTCLEVLQTAEIPF